MAPLDPEASEFVRECRELISMASKRQGGYRSPTGRYRPLRDPPIHQLPAERNRKRPCSAMRQGDEVHCHCGVFWSLSDDRPECPYGGSY